MTGVQTCALPISSAESFDYNDATGAITAKGDAAMFTLPLDQSKADAQKAKDLAGDFLAPVPSEAPDVSTADVFFETESDGVLLPQ